MKLLPLLLPYLIALLLTLIIEGILCWSFLKHKAWLRFTCLVNLFTNPLVNFVYTMIYFVLAKYGLSEIAPWVLLLLEIVVWLSEAYLFYRFGRAQETVNATQQKTISTIYKALHFSLVLNAASYLTGLLLQL